MTKSDYRDIAKEYDLLRPSYPKEVFDILISESDIDSNSMLLEIGAGTGKATIEFARNGFNIECIEVEESMAEILREKTKKFDVNISVGSFEDWKHESKEKYDLIYSAQAFHWLDKDVKYKKCYEIIKEQGKLGLIWYTSVFESEELYNEMTEVFHKYSTGFSSTKKDLLHKHFDRERQELNSTQYFNNIQEFRIKGETIEQDIDIFIDRYNATSAFETLHDDIKIKVNNELREVVKSFGGIVISTIYYTLFTANKV